MSDISDITKAYCAGLIDGEGTVTLSHNSPNENRAPAVTVASTTIELLQFLQDIFGGNISRKRTDKPHHKASWMWAVRYDAAIECLMDIAPFLLEPEKRRRAELIVREYKDVTKRNGRYTEVEQALKDSFEQRFFNPQ